MSTFECDELGKPSCYADLDEVFSFEFPEAGKKATESGIRADFQSNETAGGGVGIHGVTDAQEAC